MEMIELHPTKIEAAARLCAICLHIDERTGIVCVDDAMPERYWQPWADTEAGRSDWAVLDTAVLQWIRKYMREAEEIVRIPLEEYYVAMYSGNLAQRQAATMAAAVAIGEHMGKEEV